MRGKALFFSMRNVASPYFKRSGFGRKENTLLLTDGKHADETESPDMQRPTEISTNMK